MGIGCVTQETQTRGLRQPRGVGWGRTWDGVGGGREVQEGGHIHKPMADSC